MAAKHCNGICVMGYELIQGASGVAYAHPECELHSGYVEPEQCEEGDDRDRQCLDVKGHEPPCYFGERPVQDFDIPTACRHAESHNVTVDEANPLWRCDDCGYLSSERWEGAPF